MQRCWIILAVGLIVVSIMWIAERTREKYGRPGMFSPPLNIPIPTDAGTHPYGYTSYSKDYLNWICPTKPDDHKWCRTRDDCGKGELCFNSATGGPANGPYPEANYCTCMIANGCIEGIC